jgi:hypothetical protein
MKQFSIILLVFSSLMSCTKIIDVDLHDSSPQIVIEATVTNSSYAEVLISKTGLFSDKNEFPKVSGAVVTITGDGKNYELTETAAGIYTNKSLTGIPGHTYQLLVKVEGKEYASSSTMPLQVNLDSLELEKIYWLNKSIWVVKPVYTDPAGYGNNYMFIETINGKRFPDAWVWDDKIINDGKSTIPLIQGDSTINLNDSVEVEMRCIDKNVYRYFTALEASQNNATTPANPENKITGGAFGYFSAHTSQKKKIMVR